MSFVGDVITSTGSFSYTVNADTSQGQCVSGFQNIPSLSAPYNYRRGTPVCVIKLAGLSNTNCTYSLSSEMQDKTIVN